MELAASITAISTHTFVERTPRESNREADALAKGDLEGFNPDLQLPVTASSLSWLLRLAVFGRRKDSRAHAGEGESTACESQSHTATEIIGKLRIAILLTRCACYLGVFWEGDFVRCLGLLMYAPLFDVTRLLFRFEMVVVWVVPCCCILCAAFSRRPSLSL